MKVGKFFRKKGKMWKKWKKGLHVLDKRLVKSEYNDEKRNLPEWKPGKTWLPRLDYRISGDSCTEALR